MTEEDIRLRDPRNDIDHWKLWGPYVSERAWGTVREDYSATGEAWEYFPHDHARSRAYRWNEDGLAGISERHQRICFALALWNGRDPILKERLFGLTGNEGNHGEDVKEYYFYLDSTPTHSYMKYLYKYPQAEYPYTRLLEENRRRGQNQPEFELIDTGIFDQQRYFDVFVEYAKADIDDICICITVANRGPEAANIHLLPTLWYRNTWSWFPNHARPSLDMDAASGVIRAQEHDTGTYWLYPQPGGTPLFTENETNNQRLFKAANRTAYVKDAFHRYIVGGEKTAVNPALQGTKACVHYRFNVPGGGEVRVILRLQRGKAAIPMEQALGPDFTSIFAKRKKEADEFYVSIIPEAADADSKSIMRQAFAGLLWTKQYYHYVVRDWLNGDPAMPKPPEARKNGRNHAWRHIHNADIISMPDKWEYPWFAAWDLGFHCVALALVDGEFAKSQLLMMLREWYLHPNGQIPAYEWAFGDVNPPVHAWASYQVFLIDRARRGTGDIPFLERVFHKLLLNFTWWVNRKDVEGMNVFQGGFLGLDNIGVFDRNTMLPNGGHLEQSDGTSWMAMYSLDMMAIALELSRVNPVYEDVASKFWEHFIYIARAMNHLGDDGLSLWNEQDGFFYDVLHASDGKTVPLRVRSMVGLMPLYAVLSMSTELLNSLPAFKMRLEWFVDNRADLTRHLASMRTEGHKQRRLFAVATRPQLQRILKVMLDENEFLSPYGVRALSAYHRDHPYELDLDGQSHSVHYEPAESQTGLFGGNSNWRGPIWFPVNYLLIQALRRFHEYYGESFHIECPTRSGKIMNLNQVADEITRRLVSTFQRDSRGRRAVLGQNERFQSDPYWRDYIPFHEYFHGDTGAGVGASHQTGWTGLVAKMIDELFRKR
ncbi:MAG TPA: glucosidase [Candidatus Angelobacter sp.]|nr:glucosidase [Candidatus Angelobacter sp.]